MSNHWTLEDGRVIALLTVPQLRAQPQGMVLYAIDGERVVVGETKLDEDTRGSFTAFGVLQEQQKSA